MNLPNKLTVTRIVLTFIILIVLLFPFDTMGITIPRLFINESLVINLKYPIAGFLFFIAFITDRIDGKIARRTHQVTDLGKTLDPIADKLLNSSVLIVLAATGFIHPIIPVVIVLRDIIVDNIEKAVKNKGKDLVTVKLDKAKTYLLMIGIILTLFYNLPFELWNLRISTFLLIIASVLAIISAVEYYTISREYISDSPKKEKKDKIEMVEI